MNKLKQEKRKQTILDVYEKSSLKKNGFKYLKSKEIISKKVDNFNYVIGFSSSGRSNTLDNINILKVNVSVENIEYAKWRENHLNKYPSGLIASAKIKNIFTPGPPYVDFDIEENEKKRLSTVKELIDAVENSAYKLFDICLDTELVLKNIDLQCFTSNNIIEYFAFLGETSYIDKLIEFKQIKQPELLVHIKYYYNLLSEGTIELDIRKETFKDESKRTALAMAESLKNIKYW